MRRMKFIQSIVIVVIVGLLWKQSDVSIGMTYLLSTSTNTIQLDALEDTYVWQSRPDTSFGTSNALWIGYDQNLLAGRTFVKFDARSIADAVKQGAAQITSALLQLNLEETRGNTNQVLINANRTRGAWSESITWNQHLTVTVEMTHTASIPVGMSKGVYTWDVSNMFQDWITSGDSATPIGFRLTGSEETGNSLRGFWSRNCPDSECAGKRPRLIVNYVVTTPTPTPTFTPTHTPTPTFTPTPTPGVHYLSLSNHPTGPLKPGEPVTYTIEVANGAFPLSSVSMTNSAPSELVVLPESISRGSLNWSYQLQGQRITWTLEQTLPPNAKDQLSYQAALPTPTPTATPTALAITKLGPQFVAPGNLITYTLLVDNQTPYTLTDITITDTLPAKLTVIDPGGGSMTSTVESQIVWQESVPLISGAVLTKTFSGRPDMDITEVVNADYLVHAVIEDGETLTPILAIGAVSVTTYVTTTPTILSTPVIINSGACVRWNYAVIGEPFLTGIQCSGPTFNPGRYQHLPVIIYRENAIRNE